MVGAVDATMPGAAGSRAATDGLLRGLKAGGWGPASWGRFLMATTVRSAEQAAAHPRAAAELTALHGALAAVAFRRGARWWVTTSWVLAVTHLGMLGPRRSIGIASVVTIVRANLPAVVGYRPWLGAAAAATDKVDGIVARRVGPTFFGHYADALADAAFWAWFARRSGTSRRLVAVAGAAWVAPVVAVTAGSFASGRMVEAPRPRLLRPAAALQVVLAARALGAGRLVAQRLSATSRA